MKCVSVALFCVVAALIHEAQPANILVITFFSSKSHKITYLPLIEELGKRGHNVTFFSPVKPMKEMKNVKEVMTMDLDKVFESSKFDAFDMKEKGVQMAPTLMVGLIKEICNTSLDLPQVKALLDEKFDLVFLQPMFNDCILGLIYRLQAPYVVFTPTTAPNFLVSKVGGHFPSSITPGFMTGYSNEMSFFQRFHSLGMDLLVSGYMSYVYEPSIEKIYREKFGDDIPSINEIFANASLMLSNGHFSITGPKPYFPDVVDVGGLHSVPAKPVPKDIEDFIKKGKDGFILFSMGSAIKGDSMPDAKRKMLLTAFSKLKQQVIWKWESETMPDLPKNVLLKKWLPQQDLLGHKDIKMFITHCGGGSTEEAIYHGVPLIGIPMLGDQPQNAVVAKRNGILLEMSWNDLTVESLVAAVDEVLTNSKYRDNVKKLSTLFNDRPMKPLDLAVYWVEYVLRHNGAPHLRHAGRKLNFFSYHSYDVICAYIFLISSIIYILYAIARLILRKLCGSKSSKPASAGKKNN